MFTGREAKVFCHGLRNDGTPLPSLTRFNHTVTIFSLFSVLVSYSLPTLRPLLCNVHQEFISVFASSPSFAVLIPFTSLCFLLHLIFPPNSTVSLIQHKAPRLLLNTETKAKSERFYFTLRNGSNLFNDDSSVTCVMRW